MLTSSSHEERGGQPPYPTDDLARPEDLRNARRRVLATAQANTARVLPAWRRRTGALYLHARPALPTPPSSPGPAAGSAEKPGDVIGSTPTRSGCSRPDCLLSQGTEAILSATETRSVRIRGISGCSKSSSRISEGQRDTRI